MNTKFDDGKLQATAGLGLLEVSHLVQWDSTKFSAVPENDFKCHWKKIDPVFGRLICWINFSAGAEFLAKGVCLLNEIEIRKPKNVPNYPTGDIDKWAESFIANPDEAETESTTHFGTLGDLNENHLKQLCSKKGEAPHILLAAYSFLAKRIRNRDAHGYVPNVRDKDFSLVDKLFVPSFNLLVSWVPGGSKQLNIWRDQARENAKKGHPPFSSG